MRKFFVYNLFTVLVALSIHATGNSPWLSKVYAYMPAPGQFINVAPEYEAGDDIIALVEEQLCGGATPGLISLGAYGGYVIVGFDHPVANVAGVKDFKIYGNAFRASANSNLGSSEPGIVYVAIDANGNGVPDDEWYELAGSDYYKESTRHNFTVTYYRPTEHTPVPDPSSIAVCDMQYIRYSTSDETDPEGWVQKNTFHSQSYWPEWIEEDELTFTGTCLSGNLSPDSKPSSMSMTILDWGYADNLPNDEDEGFDIGWAVDHEGNSMNLDHVDFIKVTTGVLQQCGWIGETSTEVCGGEDLHPDMEAGGIADTMARRKPMAIYDLTGRLISNSADRIPAGIYIIQFNDSTTQKYIIK